MIALEKLNRMTKVADMIIADTESDMKEMEGAPFTGKAVAEAFGKQAASIVTLTNMIKALVEDAKEAASDHGE